MASTCTVDLLGTLASIQVGRPRTLGTTGVDDPHDEIWVTGFYKHAVEGPVWVGQLNIDGDGQADLKHHGGIDKAVLAYSADHYETWRGELGLPSLAAGGFGENLTIGQLTEREVCIGDRWRAGDVLFEVSQPRQPCWKLGRRWRRNDLPKRVIKSGRCGWYLRVLEEGTIAPGDTIELVIRPHAEWTVERAVRVFYAKDLPDEKRRLASLSQLSNKWKQALSDRGR